MAGRSSCVCRHLVGCPSPHTTPPLPLQHDFLSLYSVSCFISLYLKMLLLIRLHHI